MQSERGNREIAAILADKGVPWEGFQEFTTRPFECGVEGDWKWYGIAVVDRKLYCVPYHASVVLVIDADTKELRTIECGVEGEYK